jgi:YHS domain-containing protein
MFKSKILAIATVSALAMLTGAANNAFAVSEINAAPGMTLKGPGIAVHGYDTVAYFTEQRPVQGSAEFSLAHGGATYRFASAKNMAAFKANPGKYAPVFGGFCAFGVSVGKKFDGDPRYWKIVDGKLYVLLNQKIYKTWLKDVSGNLKKAGKNWTKIKHKDPATLG